MESISIHSLQYNHAEEVVDILVDAFLTRKEPAFYALHNQNKDAFKYSVQYSVMNVIESKTSFVAIDTQCNNKVVGVVINQDHSLKISKNYHQNFKQIAIKNNQLDFYRQNYYLIKDLRKIFQKKIEKNTKISLTKNGDILYCYMVAIHKDYSHQGIVTNLVKRSIENAKLLNYKLIFVEASNKWSKQCFVKNSFQVVNEIDYRTWQYPPTSNIFPIKSSAEQTGFNYLSFLMCPLQKNLDLNLVSKL